MGRRGATSTILKSTPPQGSMPIGRRTARSPVRAFSSEQAILASVLLPTPLGPAPIATESNRISKTDGEANRRSSCSHGAPSGLACDDKVALLDARAFDDVLQLFQRRLSNDELAALLLGKAEVARADSAKHLYQGTVRLGTRLGTRSDPRRMVTALRAKNVHAPCSRSETQRLSHP